MVAPSGESSPNSRPSSPTATQLRMFVAKVADEQVSVPVKIPSVAPVPALNSAHVALLPEARNDPTGTAASVADSVQTGAPAVAKKRSVRPLAWSWFLT